MLFFGLALTWSEISTTCRGSSRSAEPTYTQQRNLQAPTRGRRAHTLPAPMDFNTIAREEGIDSTIPVNYFAYASNMASAVIARLSPRHRYLGVACLADYRLAFTRRSVRSGTGVADVVWAPGKHVWGVLYEISEDELAAIDRKEGYDRVSSEPAVSQIQVGLSSVTCVDAVGSDRQLRLVVRPARCGSHGCA